MVKKFIKDLHEQRMFELFFIEGLVRKEMEEMQYEKPISQKL